MKTRKYELSARAKVALAQLLRDSRVFRVHAFRPIVVFPDNPRELLDAVLGFLTELTDLSDDEEALKAELARMPSKARASLGRAICAALRSS